MQAGPARLGLLLLPGFGDLEDVSALELGTAERGFAELLLILLRRVRSDPGLGLARKAASCGVSSKFIVSILALAS